MVGHISPGNDASSIAAHIPRLLAMSTPKPIYYYNYTVGECRDLVFGVSLVDYANSRDLEDGEIPKIVKICIQEIEERGLNAEGIYRVIVRIFVPRWLYADIILLQVSGRLAAVQEVRLDGNLGDTDNIRC